MSKKIWHLGRKTCGSRPFKLTPRRRKSKVMSGYQEFGVGSGDDHVGRKSNKFKGEQGRVYRVSLAYWPIKDGKLDLDATSPKFIGAMRNYLQGVGYFMNKGPEYTKIAGVAPRQAVGTTIVVWPTNNKGELDKARLQNREFEPFIWIFSADKYKQIAAVHGEWHLGQCDLKVTCTDTQYQKMTFSPCKDSLLRKLVNDKDLTDRIVEASAALKDEIARDMSLDDIRTKMTGGAGSSGNAAGFAAVTTENVDDVVDDLLAENT